MKMLDEIINRVRKLTFDQQKQVLQNLQSMQEGEKRRYQRLSTGVDVDAVIGDRVVQSSTRDLSASGVYIRTTEKFESDRDAKVVFAIPGHDTPFKLKGKIARTEQQGIVIKFEAQNPYLNRILDDAIWKTKTA